MSENIGNDIVEEVVGEAIVKLSPTKKLWSAIRKITTALIFVKWIGVIFLAWFDNVRRAVIMSALDKYPENKVWKTVLWIKTWRLIYGIIIGLLIAYYWQFDETFMKAVEFIIESFN